MPPELRVHDFGAEGLKLNVSMAKSVATINTLTLTLNPTDGFSATGRVNLQSPYHYDGAVQAQIRDLSKFNKLMAGVKGGLAGALNLAWRGKGDAASLQSTGELQLALEHGRIRDIKGIHAALDGSYSPEQLNFPAINITSSMGNFSAVIGARDNLLRIDQIAFQQGGHPLLSGSLAIPLDLRTPAKLETLIPSNGPIWANLVSNDIAFDSLFPKGQAPATGTARFSIAARGSIAQPDVRVTLIGRGLKAKAAATLAPIALNADITLQRSQLSLQTRIAPAAGGAPLLTGSVSLPVNLRTPTKPETLIPTNEPISANLATGDLELASFFPAGKAPATGIGKISITGSGSIDQPNLRVIAAGRGLQAKAAADAGAGHGERGFYTAWPGTFPERRASRSPPFRRWRLPEPSPSRSSRSSTTARSIRNRPSSFSMRMPRSSLTVITRFVPAVRYIQGTAEASVDVAGTIAKPVLSGAALLDLPAIRLADPDMPPSAASAAIFVFRAISSPSGNSAAIFPAARSM